MNRRKDCFIIAEVAQAHDGSLGFAHSYVDLVAAAGADAVKFQTHLAEHESSVREEFRVEFSRQDDSRYEYWQRTAFTEPQWADLAAHARDAGLEFISSPFSEEAVAILLAAGVQRWKVASGELTNVPLLDAMLATGLPIIFSTGLSDLEEIDAAVQRARDANVDCAVLQCTCAYPCPPQQLGLNMIETFRQRYGCPVGLSDHSGAIYAGLGAVALDADIVEVHVTFRKDIFGPDAPASLTPEELSSLVEGSRFLRLALDAPQSKEVLSDDARELREMFTRSAVAARDLEEGTKLSAEDIRFKKPGTGMPPAELDSIVGRRTTRAIPADDMIHPDDLSDDS